MESTLPENFRLRGNLQPGDIGAVVRLHGMLYAEEYGFDHTFEGYVAEGMAEFARSFDPHRERFWAVEKDREVIGSIAIVNRSPNDAQLRWFLIHPHFRGQGFGRYLLEEALRFCKERGYGKIFLWTLQNLTAATHLYTSFGFMKTEEKTHPLWGKVLTEERYDWVVS
jgi:GNAT superfamily N-acetyltransferase